MERTPDAELLIRGRRLSDADPTYFIADIAANHDGDLDRAIKLINLAAEAGADAAKFQHFQAATIVSDVGFKALGKQQSHQVSWKKSVYEVYQDASLNPGWTPRLLEACERAGIAFFTSPYSPELVESVAPYVSAFKIGSGDITWLEIVEKIAAEQKPYILATGASSLEDVRRAVSCGLAVNTKMALLQCNTNYTASVENFRFIELRVLRTYRQLYPRMVLGLSDHTPGHATVLGAIALGARIVEKHFTDDTSRTGPDHAFSMDPRSWRDMVDRSRELERALGSGQKKIEDNERETAVLQRRALRLTRDLPAGAVLTRADLAPLRPCPADGLPPYELPRVVGKMIRSAMVAGTHLRWTDVA